MRTGVFAALSDLAWRAWAGVMGPSGWRSVVGPVVFMVVAIALLVYNHINERVTDIVFWLTLGLVVTVFARILETNRRQSRALERQQRDAFRDRVTGLRNRRGLEADVDAVATVPGEAGVLVVLELDGLQAYNDRFGYATGDELLQKVAGQLVEAVASLAGVAYRVDGGRLAALVPAGDRPLGEIVLAATGFLQNDDRDLTGRSYGEVAIPADAASARLALQIAGRRLAAHRRRQHRSARRQAHAVLMAALSERHPELRDELRVAAYRAISLARRLGVEREEIDDIALAAELLGTGMLAMPEVVLESELRLETSGPAAIRSHPLEGERIIAAAPGLAPVARIVRATSERFDGRGRPDGLAGEAIPLGARIIAVSVAFVSMTSPRSPRPGRSAGEAMAKLRAAAGSEFDPRVVEALAADLAEETAAAPA